jgi:cob(I)alamin adenosyltransferase
MKIYTKTGDDGSTGLIGGRRVSKGDARLECYGTIDELNAAVGLAAVIADVAMLEQLREIQDDLFILGAHLSLPEDQPPPKNTVIPPLSDAMFARLEAQIDAAEAQLPALSSFVIPGGTELAARLHLARTICRRAERHVVVFSAAARISPIILTYLNRLSDWLFVAARMANLVAGVPDIPWRPKA